MTDSSRIHDQDAETPTPDGEEPAADPDLAPGVSSTQTPHEEDV